MDKELAKEEAALLFVGGQYMFRWQNENETRSKFVSPAAVRAAFSAEPIDTGWLLPNVRRWGTGVHGDWAVLSFPPMRHQLTIQRKTKNTPLNIPMPALVFMRTGSVAYVWAIKGEFSPDALLYNAPLPNVGSGGGICFGSGNSLEDKSIGQTWQLFLDSPFTSHHSNGKSQSQPDDVRRLLVSLRGKKRYPLNDLVPLNRRATVDEMVTKLVYEPEHFFVD